jgi:hypothetical protein
MKLKLVISVMLLVVGQQLAQAQSGGFMGKKFSVGYCFELMPYMNLLNDKKVLGPDRYKSAKSQIITGHHVTLGINLGRRTEFIGYVGLRKRDVEWMPSTHQWDGILYSVPYHQVKNVTLIENYFDFGFRRFFKQYVSPVGFYQQFMFGLVKLEFADDSKDIALRSVATYAYEESTYNISFKDATPVSFYRFTYGLGMKQMLGKSIFITVEGNIHFEFGAEYDDVATSTYSTKVFLNSVLKQNHKYHRVFDGKIGLGFIF